MPSLGCLLSEPSVVACFAAGHKGHLSRVCRCSSGLRSLQPLTGGLGLLAWQRLTGGAESVQATCLLLVSPECIFHLTFAQYSYKLGASFNQSSCNQERKVRRVSRSKVVYLRHQGV
jgi:hypothetical protein